MNANDIQTIGVVGAGTVGTAIGRCYMEWAEVRYHDIMPVKRTHSLDETMGADLVFVCLPTPQSRDGLHADLSYLERFFDSVRGSATPMVLRSTVPIGTTAYYRQRHDLPNLIHSPEFLTARCAITDAQMPARNIIGGPTCKARNLLAAIYSKRFPGVPLIVMSSDESEAVKLMCNSFFAVKIACFNEFRALADVAGLDWQNVIAGILSDGRISHAHTRVPGPDGRRGFGGGCLTKDLHSMIDTQIRYGCTAYLTQAASDRNAIDRKADWPRGEE